LSIKLAQAFQSVTEGDAVTITLSGDHVAEVMVSFIMQVTPVTASSKISLLLTVKFFTVIILSR